MKVKLIGFTVLVAFALSLSLHVVQVQAPEVLPMWEQEWYVHSSMTLVVKPPAEVVARLGPNGHNRDMVAVVPREIPRSYPMGSYPPVMAAAELGDGRVVAYGGGGSYSDTYTAQENRYRTMELSLKIIAWLDKTGGKKVLFHYKVGTYHTDNRCSNWIKALRDNGYTVDVENEVLTPTLLAGYNVLHTISPELAADVPPFAPSAPFTTAEITAIKDWVYGGGGLFLVGQADFGGYGKPVFINPVLDALGAGIKFQDDQAQDNFQNADGNYYRPQIFLVPDNVWGDNLPDNFYLHSGCTLIVNPPARVIAKLGMNGYNRDMMGPMPRKSPIGYPIGSRAPVMAAVKLGQGRLVAGPGANYALGYSSPAVEPRYRQKELGLQVVKWLDWKNTKMILFYTKDDYYNDTQCEWLITYLREAGFTLDFVNMYVDPSVKVTPELLAPYGVIMSIDAELPPPAWDNSEIAAIKEYVYGGGSYWLMGLSDYGGYGKVYLYNPILEALNTGIEFQDDQAQDFVETADGREYRPRIYLVPPTELENVADIWLRPRMVSVGVSPKVKSISLGGENTFDVLIKNDGTESDTYSIGITEDKGWGVTISESSVTLSSGENRIVKLTVRVPIDAVTGTRNEITVRVVGTGVWAVDGCTAVALEKPAPPVKKEEFPWALAGGAVVVIVVLAAVSYLVVLRGKSKPK